MSVCLFLYPSNLLAPLTVLSLDKSPNIFQFHAANSGLVEAENQWIPVDFRAEEDSPAGRVTERREVEETPGFFYEDTEKIGGDLFVTGVLTAEDFKTRGKRTDITKESESERKQDDLQNSPDRKFSVPKPDSLEIKDTKKVSESNKTKTKSTEILVKPVFHQKPVTETQTETGERYEADETQMLFTVTDCEPVDRNVTQKELKFVHVDVTSETQETDSSGLSKVFKKAPDKPRRDETQEEREKLSRTAESKQQTVSAGKVLRFHKDSRNKQTELGDKLSEDASDTDLNKNLDVRLKDSRVELQRDRVDALKKKTKDEEPLLLELQQTENEQKLLEFEISVIQSKILGAEDKILRVPKLTKETEQHQSKAADVGEETQPSAAELEETDPPSEHALQKGRVTEVNMREIPESGKIFVQTEETAEETHRKSLKVDRVADRRARNQQQEPAGDQPAVDGFLDKTAETDVIKSEQKKNKPTGITVEQEQLKMRPVRDQTCPGKGTQTPQEQTVTPVTQINPRDLEIENECSNVSQESEGKSLQDKKQQRPVRPEEAVEKQISVPDKTIKVTQKEDVPVGEHSKHRDVTTQAAPSEETGRAGREKTTKPQGAVVEKDQQVVKDETAADHHLKNRHFATESSVFDKDIDSITNESACPQKPQHKPAKLQGIVVEQDQLMFGTVRDRTFRVPLMKETKAAQQADRKVPPLLVESSRDVETRPEKLVSEGFTAIQQSKSPQTREVTVTEILTADQDVTSVKKRQIRTTLVSSKDKTHKIVRERRAKKETDTQSEVEKTRRTSHEKGKTLREGEDGAKKTKPVVERSKIVPRESKKTRQERKGVVKGGEKTEIQAEKDELQTPNELETVQNEENQTKERQNIQNSPESESDDAVSKKSKSTNVSPEETQSDVVVVKTKSGSVAPLEVEQTAKLSVAVEVTSERSPVVEEGKSDAAQSFASSEEKVFRTDRDEPVKSKVQEVHNETWKLTGILGQFSETEKGLEASCRNQQEMTGHKALLEEPTTVVRSTAAVTAVTDASEFQSKKLKSLKKKRQKLDKDTVTLEESQSESAPVKNEFGSVRLFHAAAEEQVERTLSVAPVMEVTSGEHSVLQQGGVKSETSLKYIPPDSLFQDITSSQEDVQVSAVHNLKTVVEGIDVTPSSIQPDREQRRVSIREDKAVTRQDEKETLTGRVSEEKEIKEQGQEAGQSQDEARELNISRKTGSQADIDWQESSARKPSVTDQSKPNVAAAATDPRTEAAAEQPSQAAEVGRVPPQAAETKTTGEAPGPGSVFETKVSSLEPERKERVLSQEPSRGTKDRYSVSQSTCF